MATSPRVFVTGATGLVGKAVVRHLLEADPSASVVALVRQSSSRGALAGLDSVRVETLIGDVERPDLGLPRTSLTALRDRVSHVVHAAANTRFSQLVGQARRVNTMGTAHVVDALSGGSVERFVYVSTAFTAGTLTGAIPEREHTAVPGWVNAYEQSKHEAETVVRSSDLPTVIARSSTIVCDDLSGQVSQFNAVHQALHLFHSGLAAMLPGSEECPVDLVTTKYVAEAIAALTLDPNAADAGQTFHLCAGAGSLPLGELLDRCRALWQESARWTARGIERPSITTLENYRLFEESVAQTGDARIKAVTRGLSTFVPQLAYPKRFLTERTDQALGWAAPAVCEYWDSLCRHLMTTRWAANTRKAG